jgi:transposase
MRKELVIALYNVSNLGYWTLKRSLTWKIKVQMSTQKILYPWMSETNKDANQQPFANLQSAFTRFFKHQNSAPK